MVWPARSVGEQAGFLVGARLGRGEHGVERRRAGRRPHRRRRRRSSRPPPRRRHPVTIGRRTDPGSFFVAPVSAIAAPEHREPERGERVDVAHAAVDHEAGDAARLRRGREHLTPVAELGLARRRRRRAPSPGSARATPDVDREVVARRAAHGDGRARDLGPGPHRPDPRSASRRPPHSPSVAAPWASSSAASVGMTDSVMRVSRIGGGRGI